MSGGGGEIGGMGTTDSVSKMNGLERLCARPVGSTNVVGAFGGMAKVLLLIF